MFIKVGGSLENPGGIIMVPSFKPQEVTSITDQITKCIDKRGNVPEIRYQTTNGESFISGYSITPERFHISKIVNNERRDRKFRNLLVVLHTTLEDLQHIGVKEITLNCKPQLAPIAIKRYGFQPTNGSTLEDVMKKSLGVVLVPLTKKF